MNADQLAAWVTQSRALCGLPPKVTDPAARRLVGRIIASEEDRAATRGAS